MNEYLPTIEEVGNLAHTAGLLGGSRTRLRIVKALLGSASVTTNDLVAISGEKPQIGNGSVQYPKLAMNLVRLREDGWVATTRRDDDARCTLHSLTPKGRQDIEELRAFLQYISGVDREEDSERENV